MPEPQNPSTALTREELAEIIDPEVFAFIDARQPANEEHEAIATFRWSDALAKADAILARLSPLPAGSNGWWAIETAPCDGNSVVLGSAKWEGFVSREWSSPDNRDADLRNWFSPPTHWMRPTRPLADQPASEKVCQDCGGHNPVWFAPNSLWNLVMGGPEARGDPGGIICPACFTRRAETAGIVPTGWKLEPEAPLPAEGWVVVPAEVIASCEGEQEHFEAWAQSRGYDMQQHPLHYLFMNERTYAARQGWKAALRYVEDLSAIPSSEKGEGER